MPQLRAIQSTALRKAVLRFAPALRVTARLAVASCGYRAGNIVFRAARGFSGRSARAFKQGTGVEKRRRLPHSSFPKPFVRRAAGSSNLFGGRPSSRHLQNATAHSAESPAGPERSGGLPLAVDLREHCGTLPLTFCFLPFVPGVPSFKPQTRSILEC